MLTKEPAHWSHQRKSRNMSLRASEDQVERSSYEKRTADASLRVDALTNMNGSLSVMVAMMSLFGFVWQQLQCQIESESGVVTKMILNGNLYSREWSALIHGLIKI